MNARRPPGAKQACERQVHQEVPKFCGIEHVGIIEGDEGSHYALEPQFLVIGRQLRKCGPPIGISAALV